MNQEIVTSTDEDEVIERSNFIQDIINKDRENNKNEGRVHTRFPPEPNGYLHIGHAKSICLNFGIALKNNGLCNLRFDDTNPTKEDVEYVDSIQEDVKWLGFDWEDRLFYASDYYEQLYTYAIDLIKKGKAYVCSLSAEETRETRGTLTEPGKNSPYRDRSIEENLNLFTRMKEGEFEDGTHLLRAKIDMASPNLNMRDPAIYRIKHAHHHRTADKWCIYPMYDFAHGISDSIEEITHSICTLEFENHRPLYDWFLDQLDVKCHPQQIEFARLNLTYTVMSKRKLLQLVQEEYVSGWDDPRMPTISGLRRRGCTSDAILNFCSRISVSKVESTVDLNLLEFFIREDLNKKATRVMAVLDPLKVIITNYPDGKEEYLEAENNPEDPNSGKRMIPFSKEIYIEKEDFQENPPKKFFRLAPGKEIRLKHAYYITCNEVIKNAEGNIVELHCTYDPETKGGWSNDGRKVKGTSHWVSAKHALEATVNLYETLFTKENPDEETTDGSDFKSFINPNSLKVLTDCKVEPGLKEATPNQAYQFLRQGYFCLDSKNSSPEALVFNRTVSLKDSWSKQQNTQSNQKQ